MRDGRPGDEAQNRHSRIHIPLSGEHGLAQRASAEKGGREPHQGHAREIPKMVGVSHRLIFKAPVIKSGGEIPQSEVADERSDEEGGDSAEKMEISHEHEIPPAADKAHPRPLSDEPDEKPRKKRNPERSVHGSRPLLAEGEEMRFEDGEEQEEDEEEGHHPSGGGGNAPGAAQSEAPAQKQYSKEGAEGHSGQSGKPVEISARKPEKGPYGAAEEDESADHEEHPEEEANDRRGASSRSELPEGERGDESAQQKSQDLRSQVLNNFRSVQSERPGDIPVKASYTDAHIGGISQLGERCGERAERKSSEDNSKSWRPDLLHLILTFGQIKRARGDEASGPKIIPREAALHRCREEGGRAGRPSARQGEAHIKYAENSRRMEIRSACGKTRLPPQPAEITSLLKSPHEHIPHLSSESAAGVGGVEPPWASLKDAHQRI